MSVASYSSPSAATYAPHCTSAPGPAGAFPYECIDVDGSDAVERVRSTFEYHNPSSMANGTTVCDRHHELAYYSAGVRKTMMAGPPSCISPAAVLSTGDYVLFTIPGGADRNKPVCVRTKNSATSGAWTNYACVPGNVLG